MTEQLVIVVLWTLFLVQIKHLVVDWMWQPPFEFLNKGTYGHWGGIRHAGKNAIGTALAIYLGFNGFDLTGSGPVTPALALWLGFIDFVIHYHIDWTKVRLNARWKLGPLTHAQFWWLTGADQAAHQITYLGIVAYAATHAV